MPTYSEYRARALVRARADPGIIPHGTPSGMNYWGCYCYACVQASRAEWHRRKAATNRRRRKKGTK